MTEQAKYPDVSAHWQEIFCLIDRAGGVNHPRLKELNTGERLKVIFNAPAFCLGPLYFLYHGMWRKAISFSAIAMVILYGIIAVGMDPGAGFGGACASMWAVLANSSYYKIKALGQDTWLS